MRHRVKAVKGTSPSCVPRLAASLTLLLLADCAVGPDFKKPDMPDIRDYTAQPLSTTVTSANVSGGEAQRFTVGADISADWWTVFHSKPLNSVIQRALAGNPDLKAAQAALSAAHENVLAQRGVYLPNISAGFSATRQSQPGTLAPVPSSNALLYNLFTPQVSVAYSPMYSASIAAPRNRWRRRSRPFATR